MLTAALYRHHTVLKIDITTLSYT